MTPPPTSASGPGLRTPHGGRGLPLPPTRNHDNKEHRHET
ncbi:hypothetical protein I5G60_gp47 [Mycobacterium phage Saguaro]|uniref:Uncharacterized protein n=1 Tax=Mycobacterium phage Saguaro TaxID=2315616 RepID=A0A386KCU8_9CAUD|nr:hypothetical protein I5G60_gp47 [Mycobacterium phage Saguaro]AYD82086.1 hypothetical protein SEA_SAGUARO_47 [Mycobacterium phage Saguaro]